MENKIVVVDDEPMIVKTLKRLFRDQPFVLYGFNSPYRPLERLDGIAPQVVLSDQRMPENELLPGVLIKSLRRLILGNVL